MIDIFCRTVIGERAAATCPDIPQRSPLPSLTIAHRKGFDELLAMVRHSGLTGKGGAGYPMYRKLEMMAQQPPQQRYVVINGGEHEPGSDKDRHLLERYPETVLEGALIVAHALGAIGVVFGVTVTAANAITALQSAINRLNPMIEPPIEIKVVAIPEAYLVGEESALLSALEGQPALPRGKPPFPIQSGLQGAPTLIQNVETVAHLPFIISAGVDEYLALGPNDSAATLCTFGPEFINSGVQLVPLGISMRELVSKHGGGLRSGKRIKAVQPGGPGTGFISEKQLDVAFTSEALKAIGSAVGCAAIRAFSSDDDMAKEVAEIMQFFADNSCGQCPGCRMETQMLSNIMRQARVNPDNERLLRQIPVVIKNANAKPALCGLIKMPAPPILTALQHFPEEFSKKVLTPVNAS